MLSSPPAGLQSRKGEEGPKAASNGGRKYTDVGGRPVSGTLRMYAAPSTSYPRFQQERERELGKEG